jgi:hypothetical protein
VFFKAKCPQDVIDQVEEWKHTRGVLIYATGEMYSKLVNDHNVPQVTEDTPAEDLRSMDVSKGGCYPVYLINEDYGSRGVDYRAERNPSGICMIICSPFSDRRTRI